MHMATLFQLLLNRSLLSSAILKIWSSVVAWTWLHEILRHAIRQPWVQMCPTVHHHFHKKKLNRCCCTNTTACELYGFSCIKLHDVISYCTHVAIMVMVQMSQILLLLLIFSSFLIGCLHIQETRWGQHKIYILVERVSFERTSQLLGFIKIIILLLSMAVSKQEFVKCCCMKTTTCEFYSIHVVVISEHTCCNCGNNAICSLLSSFFVHRMEWASTMHYGDATVQLSDLISLLITSLLVCMVLG